MSITGTIVSLKNSDNEYIFPETSSEAVYTVDGKTVKEVLDDVIFAEESTDIIELQKPEMVEKVNNIESNVQELTSQLETKTYYFKNISELKSKDLKVGDYVFTKGYYDINDGGDGRYIITNSELQEDDGCVHLLNNGLKAQLIHDGNIKVEQFGAKANTEFDNHDIIMKIANNNTKANYLFNIGEYKTRKLEFTKLVNGKNFIGVDSNWETNSGGTIISPYLDSDYLLKISGDTINDRIVGFSMLGFQFKSQGKLSDGIMYLQYCTATKFDLSFHHCDVSAIDMRNCWELDFENFYVRSYKNDTSAIVNMLDIIPGTSENISRILFKNVDLESIWCGFLYTSNNSIANNIMIETLSVEFGYNNHFTEDGLIDSLDKLKKYNYIPLFELGFMNGLTIGNLNLSGVSKKGYLYDKDGYNWTEAILKLNDGRFNISIANVNFNDNGSFVTFAIGDGNIDGVLVVNNVTSTIRNRTYSALNNNNLIMINNVKNGNIEIINNCFLENSSHILEHKLYKNNDLYKLCFTGTRSQFAMVYDENSCSERVFSRTTGGYQTLFETSIKSNCNIKIRLKVENTNNNTFNIKLVNLEGEEVKTYTRIVKNTNYNEYVFRISDLINVEKIKLIMSSIFGKVWIDYIEVESLQPLIQSGTVTLALGNTPETISFPEKYENVNPIVSVNKLGGVPSLIANVSHYNVTTSGFDIVSSDDNRTISYIAIGY